ncbi:DUF983 domain-containing protein [Flammeovirga pacifica]|uniref:DUF983 domain-containing protein n=1 Tax=Flammeovirga pacifica TaxID=915059 RepID=A0A1S1YX99_FLAPC|nr:DUF983 domain-containing protein [Flammeovirga pacifica]OHX65465.1 hypothetical protein NH26_03425 [Flammeovirga pacifica]
MNLSVISAILKNRCPSCREKSIFTHTAYSTSFQKVHKRCPNCNCNLIPETGFYYGAMYVSYAINTAIVLGVMFVFTVILDIDNVYVLLSAAIGPMIFCMPLIFRLSRSIYLHLVGGIKYQEKK